MKPSLKVIERDLGWAALLKSAKRLAAAKPYVKIGVLGNAKSRPGDDISNVELALIQEFGSPKNNIPERSFIRAPFRARRNEYLKDLKTLLAATLHRKALDMRQALGLMGEKIAADFKKNAPGTPPPNAESTLKKKLAKGRPGSKGDPRTLVDTGRLIDSISYSVEMGGGHADS